MAGKISPAQLALLYQLSARAVLVDEVRISTVYGLVRRGLAEVAANRAMRRICRITPAGREALRNSTAAGGPDGKTE